MKLLLFLIVRIGILTSNIGITKPILLFTFSKSRDSTKDSLLLSRPPRAIWLYQLLLFCFQGKQDDYSLD